jgi:hypothetical protein
MAAIDCVKAAVPVPADPLTAPRPDCCHELLHDDVSKWQSSQASAALLGQR